jgi:hypothetical protein
VHAIYAAFSAACDAAGVELGAFDRRILSWLSGFEPETAAVISPSRRSPRGRPRKRKRRLSPWVSNRGTRGRSCCGVGWAWRSYPRPACGGNIADLTVVTGAVFDAADRPGHDPAGIAARLTAPAPKLRRAPKPGRLQILSQPAETGQRRQPGRVRFAVLLTIWPDMTRSRDERVMDQ